MTDFKNFSENSVKVIMLSQEEALRLGHNFIGREQLLTALLGTNNGASQLLKAANVTLNAARSEVKEIIGRGAGFVSVEIPFTPNAKRALKQAIDIARQDRMPVEPEHILLTILNSEGVALRVVENLGVNVERLKEGILQQLSKSTQQQSQQDVKVKPTADKTTTSNSNNILKQLKDLEKLAKETRIGFVDAYKPLQGEPAMSEELKNAISTLARTKYRGSERWKFVITYRFSEDGIQVRTAVREDGGGLSIEFTEEEAILIANNLAGRQESSE